MLLWLLLAWGWHPGLPPPWPRVLQAPRVWDSSFIHSFLPSFSMDFPSSHSELSNTPCALTGASKPLCNPISQTKKLRPGRVRALDVWHRSQVMGCGRGSCKGATSEIPVHIERVFRRGLWGDPQTDKLSPFWGAGQTPDPGCPLPLKTLPRKETVPALTAQPLRDRAGPATCPPPHCPHGPVPSPGTSSWGLTPPQKASAAI